MQRLGGGQVDIDVLGRDWWWAREATLAEFCEDELLPFVFADAEDEQAQYTKLIGQVAARLRRGRCPRRGTPVASGLCRRQRTPCRAR